MKKYFYAIAMLFLMACSSSQSTSSALKVGLQSGYPPFEYVNAEGKVAGFDVDLAELIALKLGKKLVIEDMEFEGEILSLKQNKIDLIISGMSITPSRLAEINMVPYYKDPVASFSLVFWKEIPKNIQTLEDLQQMPHAIVSVESGSIVEDYFKQYYPQIPSKSFQGSLAPLMDVKYGKSTATLVANDVADYFKEQNPEVKVLSVPIKNPDLLLGVGIGIKKENQELSKQVSKIIQDLKASGELQKLEQKWFKGESHE